MPEVQDDRSLQVGKEEWRAYKGMHSLADLYASTEHVGYWRTPEARESITGWWSEGEGIRTRPESTCPLDLEVERESANDIGWKCAAIDVVDSMLERPPAPGTQFLKTVSERLEASSAARRRRRLSEMLAAALAAVYSAYEAEDPEEQFKRLVQEWQRETAAMSSVMMMAMHPAYQRIIGMGPAVVPSILRQLQQEPDHWFWALTAITGENPVPPEMAGNLAAMAEVWLELGRQKGWM